jgi:ABC-type arginine/histidine transport system permease subunit
MMAAFFYPVAALITGGALLVVTFLIYEGVVVWKKHHVPH